MGEEEEEIGEGHPGPAAFDEELVEDVRFLGEVGGGEVVDMGLGRCAVGRRAGGGVEEGEEGAEY